MSAPGKTDTISTTAKSPSTMNHSTMHQRKIDCPKRVPRLQDQRNFHTSPQVFENIPNPAALTIRRSNAKTLIVVY
jgi:hypothetical protein